MSDITSINSLLSLVLFTVLYKSSSDLTLAFVNNNQNDIKYKDVEHLLFMAAVEFTICIIISHNCVKISHL